MVNMVNIEQNEYRQEYLVKIFLSLKTEFFMALLELRHSLLFAKR